ncbi:membrane protein DedA with SNARE-associated domain [Tamaricihabitans halophyticus]|uniref:Membrane protein DedA with SNARE-associated domain n=1 Tax=Tamaricihabitans halophyticus TaxID=1262583 RepID=A0A4R2R0I8_9PSEU|nr:DedA family protein [Tamaricihabitans halophyticus]TCP55069.1 membrane protein DedA with SNARE-associated domain [Tamaricihabitans halophyticus]
MALLTDLIEGIASLPQPALVAATGALVLAECTIGLGFIAPGESGLLLAATSVTTPTRFIVLWLVVTVCAGIGDSIGYAIGKRFGPRLRETKLVRKIGQQHWDKATDLIRRRGAYAVFFARYLPVVRTLTPAAAGTSGLPFRKFLPAVVLGASSWSALHIGIGAGAGASAKAIESQLGTAGAVLLVTLLVIGIVVMIIRKRRAAAREKAATNNDGTDNDDTGAEGPDNEGAAHAESVKPAKAESAD